MDPVGPALWLADRLRGLQQHRRRVRVLVHRAVFLPDSREQYFMKVTNLSPSREVEITHAWFATQPPAHILNPDRPLPARLKLDQTFETWIAVSDVPAAANTERLGRVQLSTGKVMKSRPNKQVPPVGMVAGGGTP
jgi:hypothetical protein